MPSHDIHKIVNKALLGKEYEDVNRWCDEPYRWLGRKHRILRHDPLSITLKYHNDPERLAAAFLHVLTDEVYSEEVRKRRKKK